MGKRYRKTILNEYQEFAGNATEAWAGEFREQVGHFIISYHLQFQKMPSLSIIAESLINEDEFANLDIMYPHYLKYINDEIDNEEYRETAMRLGLDY